MNKMLLGFTLSFLVVFNVSGAHRVAKGALAAVRASGYLSKAAPVWATATKRVAPRAVVAQKSGYSVFADAPVVTAVKSSMPSGFTPMLPAAIAYFPQRKLSPGLVRFFSSDDSYEKETLSEREILKLIVDKGGRSSKTYHCDPAFDFIEGKISCPDECLIFSLLDVLCLIRNIDRSDLGEIENLSIEKFSTTILNILDDYTYLLKDFNEDSTHQIIDSLLYLNNFCGEFYFESSSSEEEEPYGNRVLIDNNFIDFYKYFQYLNNSFMVSYNLNKLVANLPNIYSSDTNCCLVFPKNVWMPVFKTLYSRVVDKVLRRSIIEAVANCKVDSDILAVEELYKEFYPHIIEYLKIKYTSEERYFASLARYSIYKLMGLFVLNECKNSVGECDTPTVGHIKMLRKQSRSMNEGYYKQIIYFVECIGLENLVDVLAKEKQLTCDKYKVFYHGQGSNYGYQLHLRQLFDRELNSFEDVDDFVQIQSCPLAYTLDRNVKEKKLEESTALQERLMRGTEPRDGNDYPTWSDRSGRVLSVNASLFGNLTRRSGCTMDFIIKNGNGAFFTNDNFYRNVFLNLGMSERLYDKYRTEVEELFSEYKKYYGATLLQIAIPEDKVDDWVYLAAIYSIKIARESRSGEKIEKVSEFIEAASKNPRLFSFDEFDQGSECAIPLTSASILNPESGVKVIDYPVVKDAEKAKVCQAKMEGLISRMVADMKAEQALA